MITVDNEYRLESKIRRALETTVEIDFPDMQHLFQGDKITLIVNDVGDYTLDFNSLTVYIEHLCMLYAESELFLQDYKDKVQGILRGCVSVTRVLRHTLEFTFTEIISLAERNGNPWFSEYNMNRFKTALIETLPYRMFVTLDEGVHGETVANLRMVTSDGYIVTLGYLFDSVDSAVARAINIRMAFSNCNTLQKMILANLYMVWDTTSKYECKQALTFTDVNNNSFTVVTHDFITYSIVC